MSFDRYSTNYIWLRSTSNMIGHLWNSHHITKASLNIQSAKEILKDAQMKNLPKSHDQIQQQ